MQMNSIKITPHTTQSILEYINEQTDGHWELKSLLAGGVMGRAWRVSYCTNQAVLKLHDPKSSVPYNPDAPKIVAYIRKHGYPTPEWLVSGVAKSGYSYSIQDFIPGARLTHLDIAAAKIIIDLVRLQRTLSPPTTLSWSSYMRDHVFQKHISHAKLKAAGGDIAKALVSALVIAAPYDEVIIPDNEMVHADLSVSNILVQNGHLTGVVDIDAVGRGCAVYDLLIEALNGVIWDADPKAIEKLHKFGLETYGPGPVAIAAGTLVIEGLAWRLDANSKTVDQAASKSLNWLKQISLLIAHKRN